MNRDAIYVVSNSMSTIGTYIVKGVVIYTESSKMSFTKLILYYRILRYQICCRSNYVCIGNLNFEYV